MIELSHTPTTQALLDRWRLELPVVAQLDESQLTKEHLRLLICMLISVIERNTEGTASDLRLLTSDF
jgi:hypothetical protein